MPDRALCNGVPGVEPHRRGWGDADPSGKGLLSLVARRHACRHWHVPGIHGDGWGGGHGAMVGTAVGPRPEVMPIQTGANLLGNMFWQTLVGMKYYTKHLVG